MSSLYDAVAQRSTAAVIDAYSTSFGLATRLLAKPLRGHIRNVYGLVRLADEVVDGGLPLPDDDARAQLCEALHEETRQALELGYSTNLVVHSYALTARRFSFPEELTQAFFRSMLMDTARTEHSEQSYQDYIYGSAEVVGLMCLRVFVAGDDRRYRALTPAARSLGAAFQKINFLRDLGADVDGLGRSYFPEVSPDHFDEEHKRVVVADIRQDLLVAASGVNRLPRGARVAVACAYRLFAALTDRLETTPASALRHHRIRISTPHKAALAAQSIITGGRL